MKKTLEDELMSLAHRILRLRGRGDLEQMKILTRELYEKLSILSFAEKHFSGAQPTIGLQDVTNILSEKQGEEIDTKPEKAPAFELEITPKESIPTEKESEEVAEQEVKPAEETFIPSDDELISESEQDSAESKPDLEETPETTNTDIPTDIPEIVELEDSSEIDLREISVHFDDLPQFEPISLTEIKPELPEETQAELPEEPREEKPHQVSALEELFPTSPKIKNRNDLTLQKRSLNESLNIGLSFGLNDRLAFIKNLFDGRAEDFNRVISQLNSFENYSEARDFIKDQIKPDYDWEDKATYEERFLQVLEQRMEE